MDIFKRTSRGGSLVLNPKLPCMSAGFLEGPLFLKPLTASDTLFSDLFRSEPYANKHCNKPPSFEYSRTCMHGNKFETCPLSELTFKCKSSNYMYITNKMN